MQDISVKIFRPVAMPKQFAGAPETPAILSIGICSIIFFVAAMADTDFPIFWVFLMIAIHLSLIAIYTKEPHLSTLMNTFQATNRTARSIGPARDKTYYP